MAPDTRTTKTGALKPRSANTLPKKTTTTTKKAPTKKQAGPKKSMQRSKQAAARRKDAPAPNPEPPTIPPTMTLEDAHLSVMAVDNIPGLAPEDQQLVHTATGWTAQYCKQQGQIMNKFLGVLKSVQGLSFLTEEVEVDGEVTLNLIKLVSGKKTQSKLAIINKCMIVFAVGLKFPTGKLFQPNTVETQVKTLLAILTRDGVCYNLSDLDGFTGSMQAVMKVIWKAESDRDPTFGTKPNTTPFTTLDEAAIREHISSPGFDDREFLQSLIFISLGLFFASRGRKTHQDLEWSNIVFGKYGPEMGVLAGILFVQIMGLLGKTNQIEFGKFV
jgi:hypothetical protein